MNIRATVALDKEAHPDKYCPARRCLWRTDGEFCPRHAGTTTVGRGKSWEYTTTRNEPTGE
jgi:hypothetical protein